MKGTIHKDDSTPSNPCSNALFAFNIALVMTTYASSLEDQIIALIKVIEELAKHVWVRLMNFKANDKINNVDGSRVIENALKVHNEAKTSVKQLVDNWKKSKVKELQISCDGLIPVKTLMKTQSKVNSIEVLSQPLHTQNLIPQGLTTWKCQ